MKTLISTNVAEKLHRLASNASNPITQSLGVWVARVLLEEKYARVELDETPWDVSSRAVRTNEPFDLAKYETVEQFLEGEATGNTCATYMSGMGFTAEMYSTRFSEEASDLIHAYLVANFPEILDAEDATRIDDDIYEELADELLDIEFMQAVLDMTVPACLEKYSALAIASKHKKAILREERGATVAVWTAQLKAKAGLNIERVENIAGHKMWQQGCKDTLFAMLDGMQQEIGREALAATLYFAKLSLSNSLRPELAQRYGVPHVPA